MMNMGNEAKSIQKNDGSSANRSERDSLLPFRRRFFGHLKTINHHKLLVMGLCFKCGLYKQGLTHDLSKYSPTEFFEGVRYFQGFRSPNAAAREQKGYSRAWLHHKGRNRHHYEYWVDVAGASHPDKHVVPYTMFGIEMPFRYVVEMVCDRIAACKTYEKERYADDSALNYFLRETNRKELIMHPNTQALLEELLTIIAQEGEERGINRIKSMLKSQGGSAQGGYDDR